MGCGCCDDAARFPGSGEPPCPSCGHTVEQCGFVAGRHPCLRCGGTGETGPMLACGPGTSTWIDKAVCWVCRGTKTVSTEQMERMDLGQRVRAERLRQGIHQAGLAGYLGIDRVAYSKAEALGVGDARTFDCMADWVTQTPERRAARRLEHGEAARCPRPPTLSRCENLSTATVRIA